MTKFTTFAFAAITAVSLPALAMAQAAEAEGQPEEAKKWQSIRMQIKEMRGARQT